MAVKTAAQLLDRIAESGLVPDEAMASLRLWVDTTQPGLGQFAQEVLSRGLFTRYQLREVAAGRAAGLTVGSYRLLDLIGEGGMGRVFLGRHTRLDREVAIKLVRSERLAKPTTLARFLHEIRVAARLHHPNVVLAIDADVIDGVPYYAMEYVPGADLGQVVAERGPLPVSDACGYIRQAADGLQHAADLGLVHRDVKPNNLLLTPDGRVKLLDLGLALLTADPQSGAPNRAGTVVGSPDYLAPEQARQFGAVDTRADVYSLGCTLFFLLTGRPPFGGEGQMDKVLRHLTLPPPSVRVDRPDVPPELDTVVQWMLAKDPAARPQTPAAVAEALAPFSAGGSGRTAPSPPTPVSQFADVGGTTPTVVRPLSATGRVYRGWRRFFVTGGLGLGLIIVGVLLWSRRSGGDMPPEFVNAVGMKLVRLDGGPFTMGSSDAEPGRGADEQATPVTIAGPFYIGTTEVTHGQYLAVMGRSPARWPSKMRDAKTFPVDSVTVAEALEFCTRLSEKAPRHGGWAYRLPTEGEWEYAARADTTTPFWSGDRLTFGRTAIHRPDANEPIGKDAEIGRPHPVGSTLANPFGLYEVAGNVWEWTTTGVLRGGSWREPAVHCRSAVRRIVEPHLRADDVGFRVVYAPGSGTTAMSR